MTEERCPKHGTRMREGTILYRLKSLGGGYTQGKPHCPICIRESPMGQLFKKLGYITDEDQKRMDDQDREDLR